jgi:hypothetical protein
MLHQCKNLGDFCALLNEATYLAQNHAHDLRGEFCVRSLVKEKLVVILLAFTLVVYVTKGIVVSALAH